MPSLDSANKLKSTISSLRLCSASLTPLIRLLLLLLDEALLAASMQDIARSAQHSSRGRAMCAMIDALSGAILVLFSAACSLTVLSFCFVIGFRKPCAVCPITIPILLMAAPHKYSILSLFHLVRCQSIRCPNSISEQSTGTSVLSPILIPAFSTPSPSEY